MSKTRHWTGPGGLVCFALSILLACACSDDDGDVVTLDGGVPSGDLGPDACAGLMMSYKGACVPKPAALSCKDDEVPSAAGVCTAVGVKACTGGLKLPSASACTVVGPGSKCASGWKVTKDGWCEPTVPTAACKATEMEVLGKATCQPVKTCGSGTWGGIKTTASTIYVNAAYAGSSSDGTASKPYKTIADAIKDATSGGHIAVAAGTYEASFKVYTPVTIEGVCPAKVTLKGASSGEAAVTLSAPGSRLLGVTITGPAKGVISTASSATLERVIVTGTAKPGVDAQGDAISIKDSLFAENSIMALLVRNGSVAKIERSVVRDSKSMASGSLGFGVQVGMSGESKYGDAKLEMTDCLLSKNADNAITLISGQAKLTRVLIRDTGGSNFSSARPSVGVYATVDEKSNQVSSVEITDSVITGGHFTGVGLFSSKGTITRTVIRDTKGAATNAGSGIRAAIYPGRATAPVLTLTSSAVVRTRDTGIHLWGADATISKTLVQDTASNPTHKMRGTGIELAKDATTKRQASAKISDSILNRNASVSLVLLSSKATVERSIISDTKPRLLDKANGTGVMVRAASSGGTSSLSMTDCLVTKARKTALEVVDATLTLKRVAVQNVLPQNSDLTDGTGVAATRCTVNITDTAVAHARNTGLFFIDSNITLDGAVVRSTLAEASNNQGGIGLQAWVSRGKEASYKANLKRLVVSGSNIAGVHLSTNATLENSLISDTKKEPARKGWGDGILAPRKGTTVTVRRTHVEKSARAGLLYVSAGGLVEQSMFTGGQFSISLEDGSTTTVKDSNVYEKNTRDPVGFGLGLSAGPPVKVPKL